eukprot:tig00021293_g20025.t1
MLPGPENGDAAAQEARHLEFDGLGRGAAVRDDSPCRDTRARASPPFFVESDLEEDEGWDSSGFEPAPVSNVERLPDEVLAICFAKLPSRDRANVRLTSRRWNAVGNTVERQIAVSIREAARDALKLVSSGELRESGLQAQRPMHVGLLGGLGLEAVSDFLEKAVATLCTIQETQGLEEDLRVLARVEHPKFLRVCSRRRARYQRHRALCTHPESWELSCGRLFDVRSPGACRFHFSEYLNGGDLGTLVARWPCCQAPTVFTAGCTAGPHAEDPAAPRSLPAELAMADNTHSMRGDGFYNKNSLLQRNMLETATDLLDQVAEAMDFEGRPSATLADFGASQGRNSVVALAGAVRALRRRAAGLAVHCVFNDLPSNDWNTLARLLADPACALTALGAVYTTLAPRSFYEQVLPPGSVDCGFSFTALHWMRRVPVEAPSAFYPDDLPPHERAAFAEQAAKDWEAFLVARRAELRPGGRLCLVFPARRDDGASCLAEWVRPYDSALRAAEA